MQEGFCKCRRVSQKRVLCFVTDLCGFLLANNILILVSIIPFTLMAFGYYLKCPTVSGLTRLCPKTGLRSENCWSICKSTGRVGIWFNGNMRYCAPHFELVEGTNYCAVWKGFEPKEILLNYTVRCTASGTYTFRTTGWRARHAVGAFSINRNMRRI